VPTPVVVVSDDVEIFADVTVAERHLEPWVLEGLRVFHRNCGTSILEVVGDLLQL
jgi:hypothetical protein